ncbi:MAG: mannonate dehydratase [Clostridia bacterium]
MKMTFRWYGDNDNVKLNQIRQIPVVKGIVSAVYDVPAGEVWSEESILKVKNAAHAQNLTFEVVESVPVHENIKLKTDNYDVLIDNYIENIKRLSKHGVKVICYNFMPVFDWLRSEMRKENPDGSNALAYDEKTVLKMNPLTSTLSLPGWDESYTREELVALLKKYEHTDEEKLWENLTYFLGRIIPAAEQYGVKMAIHPDDPPWGIFGLPRIITDEKSLVRFLNLYPSEYNGVTFCTGSWGAAESNNLTNMIKVAKGRVHFVHIRNIKYTGKRAFEETAHPTDCGSLDIYGIVKALVQTGFNGYVRPDHGRMIWGEEGKPGYGLYDRALGAMYVAGLFEALQKELN